MNNKVKNVHELLHFRETRTRTRRAHKMIWAIVVEPSMPKDSNNHLAKLSAYQKQSYLRKYEKLNLFATCTKSKLMQQLSGDGVCLLYGGYEMHKLYFPNLQ